MAKKRKNMPIVAICYDFDKTLSPKDMQEFGLIPKLNCEAKDFWEESSRISKENGMDKILAYMMLIIKKAKASNVRLTEEDFKELGKSIELYPGVEDWFERIDAIAVKIGVQVEHYIISAGLKEIIEGTSIAKHFKNIYASSFMYSTYGEPEWPKQVVNYTTKTQYLFRINKDCTDLSDEEKVNDFIPEEQRRIPFKNFIYIGDSATDIPAMKIVKNGGGCSIGVYNNKKVNFNQIKNLLQQNRVDFLMPANYSKESRLERLVEDILLKIKSNYDLEQINKKQKHFIDSFDYYDSLCLFANIFMDDYDEEKAKEFREMVEVSSEKDLAYIIKKYNEPEYVKLAKNIVKNKRKEIFAILERAETLNKAKEGNNENKEDNGDKN